jgi:hypothetical protein
MSEVKASRSRTSKRAAKPAVLPALSQEERHARIAVAAYYLAEKRGFVPGHEWEDWFRAEAELGPALAPAPAPDPIRSALRRSPRRRVKKVDAAGED